MKTKDLSPAVAPVSRLMKMELPELCLAVSRLAAIAKREVKEPKSQEVAVKRVIELRLAVAVAQVGEGHKTVQSLAEALLRTTVADDVGLTYEEVLHVCKDAFPEAQTSMNSVRWYACRLNKELKAAGGSLPARPMSA